MSKEGRIIEFVDAKEVIRRNAETASDWEFQKEAAFFTVWQYASEMNR